MAMRAYIMRMTSPTDPRRFLYRADALDPDLAQKLAREALAKADDGELYLQYRATESFGFDDGRLKTADYSTDAGFGLRAVTGEMTGFAHASDVSAGAIRRAAETLAGQLRGRDPSPAIETIERRLREALGISIVYRQHQVLRDFDATMRHLIIDPSQPAETRRFQLAHQLAALALAREIAAVIEASPLRTAAARQLLHVGLANYAAGAVLMPYAAFRASARAVRHDIDRLRLDYGVSFEQACHRLSTLQRPGARGIPMFFCRVDMAGNITKRHSATRLQFARFGGACPLWIVHEAAAIPDRILFQLAETPDGLRYVSMAKGLVKPSGSYARSPRRYAVALGCEAQYAADFVYADGVDVTAPHAATRIGSSCRICPRDDCDQRAFPPSDRPILVDPDRRDVVPYRIG